MIKRTMFINYFTEILSTDTSVSVSGHSFVVFKVSGKKFFFANNLQGFCFEAFS